MADRPDIKTVFSMPEFRQLPGPEKIKFLDDYPEFAGLESIKEKADFINSALQQIPVRPKGFWTQYKEATVPAITGMPEQLAQAARDPSAVGQQMARETMETGRRAKQHYGAAKTYFKQGEYLGAVEEEAKGLGYDIQAGLGPVYGPILGLARESAQRGEPGTAAGYVTQLVGPEVAGQTLGGIRNLLPKEVGPIVKPLEKLPPELEAYQRRSGGQRPFSLGQRTGSPRMQRVERSFQFHAGSEPQAKEYFGGHQEELARQARESMAKAGQPAPKPPAHETVPSLSEGESPEKVGAGQNIDNRLASRESALQDFADKQYESMRRQTARVRQTVQTGTREVPGARPEASLHPSGMPRTEAVMETFETPVALQPIRQGLQEFYEGMKSAFPEARRQLSPAWKAIDEFMTSAKTHMNAMDFDRFLGAMKSMVREGETLPGLTTRAQGAGLRMIDVGERAFRSALGEVSPQIERQLERARASVREYHETAELRAALGSREPVSVFQKLTAAGDQHYNLLREVFRMAPQQVKTIGRTYLAGLIENATAMGGFKNTEGIFAAWKKLGNRTKAIMFGPQLTQELNDLFKAAKTLSPAEGSATAWRGLAAGTITLTMWEIARGFFGGGDIMHSVVHGLAGAAGAVSEYYLAEHLGPRLMARMLLAPGGARILTEAFRLPQGSAPWARAMKAFSARAALAADQERREEAKPAPYEPDDTGQPTP